MTQQQAKLHFGASDSDPWLFERLACPVDGGSLRPRGVELVCEFGHSFALIDGVPILFHPDVEPVGQDSRPGASQWPALAAQPPLKQGVDSFVQKAVVGTCGIMYRSRLGKLTEYPSPRLRLPPGAGQTLLDIGCNWGRWSLAASRIGYQVVGIDPDPEAIFAARRVARQLGLTPRFVVGDARHLPFRRDTFDWAYSYSVLQHFSPEDVGRCLDGVRRVLKPEGRALIQMANSYGLRSLFVQARRRFREARGFEVRYWTTSKLKVEWQQRIGPTTLSVDGFFSLNIQPAESHLLPLRFRLLIALSEVLREIAKILPPLRRLADSVYLHSVKSAAPAPSVPQ